MSTTAGGNLELSRPSKKKCLLGLVRLASDDVELVRIGSGAGEIETGSGRSAPGFRRRRTWQEGLAGWLPGVFTRDTVTTCILLGDFWGRTRDISRDKA